MKIVKRILLIVAIIIAVPLIAALFIKKDYTITREVVVNRPAPQVFGYVKYLKNQDNFNKWIMTDPGAQKSYRGTDGTVGFAYAWNSKMDELGEGEQVIKKIDEGHKLDYDVHFVRPFENDANISMATEPVSDNQTKVKWVFQGSSKYPMNFMNLFIDNILGKDLATSLDNLKTVLEKS
jgi:hypothetical protein